MTTRRPLLPPYSGTRGPCPKCGLRGVGTNWHMSLPYPVENPRGDRWTCWKYPPRCEHLCRLCNNCGYGWIEAVVEANADPAALHSVSDG